MQYEEASSVTSPHLLSEYGRLEREIGDNCIRRLDRLLLLLLRKTLKLLLLLRKTLTWLRKTLTWLRKTLTWLLPALLIY